VIHCNGCRRELLIVGGYANWKSIKQHAEYTYSFYCHDCTEIGD